MRWYEGRFNVHRLFVRNKEMATISWSLSSDDKGWSVSVFGYKNRVINVDLDEAKHAAERALFEWITKARDEMSQAFSAASTSRRNNTTSEK